MASLSTQRMPFKNNFSVIADSLLQEPGLPFASVLEAESIERVFREDGALFGQADVFSTQLVLWAFLAQTLRDGKGVACSAAVADISAYLLQTGQRPPCGDTGDYCRARAKLKPTAVQHLTREVSWEMEDQAPDAWLWKGRHAKLIDGFTFTMPDTPANQERYPQNPAQRPGDHLITWARPQKPAWMSQEHYDRIPETLTLREVKFHVTVPGRRTRILTIVTTLTDAQAYSKEDLAELYGFRWNVELDIRQIKQTLHLDHVRCKTQAMVHRELWVTLLAYNLIRKVIATAAALHKKRPRQLGFTLACQSLLASWMLLATGSCREVEALRAMVLARIAANEVADRPGRIEPRVLKRRRHHYPLMQRPRDQLRAKLQKT